LHAELSGYICNSCLCLGPENLNVVMTDVEDSIVRVKVYLHCCDGCVEDSIVRVKVHAGLVAGLSQYL